MPYVKNEFDSLPKMLGLLPRHGYWKCGDMSDVYPVSATRMARANIE